MATRAKNYPDYDSDGYGWAMAQAALIRERRFNELDIDNLAEEIESMGKSEWRAVESALRVVLLHILKWQNQPAHRSRSWANSIAAHRAHFEDELAANPSLKPHLDEIRRRAYRLVRVEAERETGLDAATFAEAAPDWDVIRTEPFAFDPQ
jgi:Domain of unknown function DUF29